MLGFTQRWLYSVNQCLSFGVEQSPRDMLTKELIGTQIIFDMKDPVLCIPERQLGTAFLCFEPFWILSGDNRLSTIKPFAPMMERFSDEGEFLSGSYGPKIIDQIPYIIRNLEEDPLSRQAIINIWREKPGKTKDCPCTITYQFLIRDDKLHLQVYMRSNDLYLGTVYDVFTQTMVAYAVCLLLRKVYPNLTLGNLNLNIGSMHIYSNNFEILEKIVEKYVNPPLNFDILFGHRLTYDYHLSFEDLKEYLHECAKELANDVAVDYGFLKGLLPKNDKQIFKEYHYV